MAEVWRAKTFGEQGFEKLVAIKRILPNIAEDDEFITMFIDEAKITVQLTHANIAQVFDLGKIGDSYFIAMEYVAGKDLRAIFDRCRKRNEPAPIPMVCYMVGKMCEGLDYAHRKKDSAGRELNIVHRDVSPQNCLVSFEGEVKVIDFGIAKAANKATKTQAGILKGKFGYMSPEQVRGLPLDQRSDVFACGVVLYEMLTGERLFVGESDFSVLEKVRQVDILPPTKYNRRIPDGLEKIVMKALAKDPEERYQYASDLADDLQRFLITSDTVFSRKDLMQYMKATFAEEVEREKVRQAEYAEIRLPPGMAALAAAAGGQPAAAAPRPAAPPPPPVAAAPAARPPPPPRAAPPARPAPTLGGPGAAESTAVVHGSELFGDAPPPPPIPPAGGLSGLFEDEKTLPPGNGTGHPEVPSLAPPVAPHAGPPVVPTARRPTAGGAIPAIAPARPPPVARPLPPPPQRPPTAPPPSTYKPRMQEAKIVSGNGRKKLVLVAAGAAIVVVGALALVMMLLGRDGAVFVAYEPRDAKAFIDGAQVCPSSPCVANKIPAGPHRLEIRKENFVTHSEDIKVPAGDIYRRAPDVKLKPLVINISAVVACDPADAEIKVNGKVVKELGRPGIYSDEFTVGETYVVLVSKPGFEPWEKTIKPLPTDKQINEFAGPLQRLKLVVQFTSTPLGAEVIVNGKNLGQTPLTVESLDPSATHAVLLRKRCYQDATHTIMPGGGDPVIDKKLVKKPTCN
ncbi:MAG: protein kinase domain-containing protein [Myxococcales bacterium]